jgi:hypothetical protein
LQNAKRPKIDKKCHSISCRFLGVFRILFSISCSISSFGRLEKLFFFKFAAPLYDCRFELCEQGTIFQL